MATQKPQSNRPLQKGPAEDEIEIASGSVADQLLSEKMDFNEWMQARIKDAPWWGISTAFHVLLILIMSTLMVGDAGANKLTAPPQEIKLPPPVEEKKLDMELPRDVIDHKSNNMKPAKDDNPADNDPVWKDAEESDHNETDDGEDYGESKGDSYDFVSDKPLKGKGVYDMIGIGGGAGSRYGGPRGGRRNLVAKGGGGGAPTAVTENAVTIGLYWLARHQNPDGSWGARSFQNQCKGVSRCSGEGDSSFDIGLTGLALLAFTGSNYSPSSRETYLGINFGQVVSKAAGFLKRIQKENGIYGDDTMQKFMYNQGIASYAMSDLYCVMKDKAEPAAQQFKETAIKGINFVMDAQNTGKAWRYKPKSGESDASVTGWCMMALKTANEGGLVSVPQNVWDGVKSHLDEVTDLSYGGVGYREKGNVAILGSEREKFERGEMYMPKSLTAVGMMCRIFMGQKRSDAVIENSAGELIQDDNLPKWDTGKYGKIDYYYWFYSSYALNQFDGPKGPKWSKWEKEMVPVVVKSQKTSKDGCANGSWEPIDRWSGEGSRIYCTAINVLTLEVYYRLHIVSSEKH